MKLFVLKFKPGYLESAAETEFSEIEPFNTGAAPRCPRCGSFIGAVSWLPPHHAELILWQKAFGDIAFGSTACDFLVSERFRRVMIDSKLKGLKGFEDVEIKRIKRHAPFEDGAPRYYHVSVNQSNALIDDSASGLKRIGTPVCPVCRSSVIKSAKKIVLEPGTWIDEDIFIAQGLPGKVLTSERFKVICDENKLSNVILIPADQFSFDHYSQILPLD